MKKEEIHLDDWQRILLGQAPVEFMLEVVIRTVLIYLILLVVMRILGKRMSAQLSISEMAVLITLGAIVSVPMQIPDRGLIPGVVVLVCVLLFQRGLSWWSFRSRKVELLAQGDMSLLVKDGCLQYEEMKKTGMSHELMFASLRSEDICQLGQVKRAYLEACGSFSIYRNTPAQPGLSIVPGKDDKLRQGERRAENLCACVNCGNTKPPEEAAVQPCERCGAEQWTYAVQP